MDRPVRTSFLHNRSQYWGEHCLLSGEHALSAVTVTHRLILPVDANHHGTLYAGRCSV